MRMFHLLLPGAVWLFDWQLTLAATIMYLLVSWAIEWDYILTIRSVGG